ncbi:MAG: Esa1p-associated factor [Watsoniomyces obsoletus]|nr:MAG: Esa1p-associated factor [Watsoniomyces obsoletus]
MEPSPLTLQARPESFQPKIVELYQTLFNQQQNVKSEGFWREFFLLPPNTIELRRILGEISPDGLLQLQSQTQTLFSRAVVEIKNDKTTLTVQTLTAFLVAMLSKKFTNPSSEIIALIAGLDQADTTLTEVAADIDTKIRHGESLGLRQKVVNLALVLAAVGYKTPLLSYFIHRDLFPSIMKYIHDAEQDEFIVRAFILLGLLANYNKFEFQNPYRMRMGDFVNENIIRKIIAAVGRTCSSMRDEYVAVQDDSLEEWSVTGTLAYLGLGSLGFGKKAPPRTLDEEAAKTMFGLLPPSTAAVLLSTYDFVNANKLFCFNMVSMAGEKQHESAFSAYLSLTSYLVNHAHQSLRTGLYARLNLVVLRILIEDAALCKQLCNSNETKLNVRLCRQRQPYLPVVRGERVPATIMLDIAVDGINHNLRRRLDVDLYLACVGIIFRIISSLSKSRTRLVHHWSDIWRSLLSFVRFLTSYASSLRSLSQLDVLLDDVMNLIALALHTGDAFLPGPADYDDLFYKVVETGDVLMKFRDVYNLSNRPTNAIAIPIEVSKHYTSILSKSHPQTTPPSTTPSTPSTTNGTEFMDPVS